VSAFRVGDWLVEPTLNSLSRPDSTVRLEPKVMQVLVCLAEHPGKLTSKDRLLRSVWPGTFVTEDVLTRAISELRHVLGDDPKQPRFIETIPKGGYRLVADVTPASDPARESTDTTNVSGSSASAVSRPTWTSVRVAPGLAGVRSALARRRSALLAAALTVMIAAGTAGSWRWIWPRSPAVTGSRLLTRSGQVMFPDRHLMHFPGLATDGTRVYYSEADQSWGEKLTQVSLADGSIAPVSDGLRLLAFRSPSRVPTPFRRLLLHHISLDGSKLLVQEQPTALGLEVREGPLWALPLGGPGPLRLGDVLAHDAAWSSDGRQLAFANGRDLYIAGWEGSNPRKLATPPGRAYWLRWAPDDSALRFTLTDTMFRTSLWEVNIDGTGLRRLLPEWRSDAQPCCGEWSPDGRHFVFLVYENGRSDVWMQREPGVWRTGADPVRLTSGPLNVASVIFSRDGRRLIAVSPQTRETIVKFDSATRRIEPYRIKSAFVLFSPDRQWVVYVALGMLWRARADGSETLQLTSPPLLAGWPSWSPDGKQIAFVGFTRGGPYKLYVVPSSGGAIRQLIPGERQETDPSWSPDGRFIMFGRPPAVMAEPGMPKAIHLLDLRSGETTQLPGSDDMFSPRWTPDGRYVVAMPHENWNRLMRFDFVSQKWSELVPYDAATLTLAASEWVYFESEHDGRHLGRARLRDGRIERVVEFEDVTLGTLMTCNGTYGIDLDGSPLLSCVVKASELYVLEVDLP
jgi:DNA-binding winged helix-turn-helix (wHTH) protein/Tol biopolymer transport system component